MAWTLLEFRNSFHIIFCIPFAKIINRGAKNMTLILLTRTTEMWVYTPFPLSPPLLPSPHPGHHSEHSWLLYFQTSPLPAQSLSPSIHTALRTTTTWRHITSVPMNYLQMNHTWFAYYLHLANKFYPLTKIMSLVCKVNKATVGKAGKRVWARLMRRKNSQGRRTPQDPTDTKAITLCGVTGNSSHCTFKQDRSDSASEMAPHPHFIDSAICSAPRAQKAPQHGV